MTEFDLNNPFNEAPKDGMLADGCGIFERYYTNGQVGDLCGLSPDPKDFDNPQTLYQKILDLVKRIIIAVDLNTNGTYKPSDFDIFPLIANATSVKSAIEQLSIYITNLQEEKFDKLNLKLKYDNGIVSLVFNDDVYTSINIPEEQFLDNEETTFIPSATTEDWKKDPSVIIGKPYLRLAFKTINSKGEHVVTYTYIPMSYLFNVYTVDDTDSIDMHLTPSGETNILQADLRINDDTTNALKVDTLGVYVEDLNPVIENEVTRAKEAEKELSDNLDAEITRATNMEYNIVNMVSNETDRAIKEEEKLKILITNETTRADEVEQQLYNKIQEEKERASNAEMDLKDELDLEVQRSKNKDSQLTDAINNEVARAKEAEKILTDNLDGEITRAKNEETRIENLLNNNVSDLEEKITNNSNTISSEITRAKGEETRIETKFDNLTSTNKTAIETEVTRAKGEESRIETKFDGLVSANTTAIENEVTRAKAAETSLDTKITNETTRAKSAEKINTDAIAAETTRAKAAEQANTTAITAEVTRAKAAEKTNADAITALDVKVSANTTAIATKVDKETGKGLSTNDFTTAEKNKLAGLQNYNDTTIKNSISANTTAIANEVTRAKAAEKVNADAIDLLETTVGTHTTDISTLRTDLSTEVTRATNKEAALQSDINAKLKSITGSNGINAVTDANKNVTISTKIKTGDKILSTDSNGLSSTLGMSISGKTITLSGVGNTEIAKVTVPGDDLTFAGSSGITVTKNGTTVTSTIVVDPNSTNKLTKSNTGLMVAPENITLVDSTAGTKTLTTTANLVIVNVTSQLNYIGISNSKQDKMTFFNNSDLEVLFSFGNSTAGNNKLVKDYTITNLALPSKGSIDFVKRADGWHISSLFGLSYFPDLSDASRSDEYALIIKKDGTTTIEEIVDMKTWDESILNDLSAVQLENMFPDAPSGFQLVCYTHDCIYEKANEYGGWVKINCVKV